MPSTIIRSFAYDPAGRTLDVTFTTGRRYHYREVPPEAAEAFRRAFSKGRHFNRHIRNRYECSEITDDPKDDSLTRPAAEADTLFD